MSSPSDDTIDVVFDPCSPVSIEPSSDTTAAERQSVASAIELWNAVFPTQLTLEPVPQAQHLPIRFEDAAPAFHGVYDDEVGALFVNRSLRGEHERSVTIAHELGHAFGLFHDPSSSSVMRQGNLEIEPSLRDRDHLTQLWGMCSERAWPGPIDYAIPSP